MRRKLAIFALALLAGFGVRALVEVGMRVVNIPALDRAGWLATVISLSLATAAVFALATGSRRGLLLVLPLLAVAVAAWRWQPAGIGELSVGLCLLAGICAGWVTSKRQRTLLTAGVVFLLACLYAIVAEPAQGAALRFVWVVVAPAIVLALAARPGERAQVRALLWSAVPFMLAAGLSAYPFRDSAHVAEDLPRGQPVAVNFNTPFWTDFSPVLVFTRSKDRPVTIDEYVIQASGRDLRTGQTFELPRINPDKSVQPGPCDTRNPPCFAIDNPCYPTVAPGRATDCVENQGFAVDDKTRYGVYPRVLAAEETAISDAEVDSGAFAGPPPYEDLTWLVQYWFFYPYDLWRSSEGLVLQQHPGDWEAVSVGFSSTEPLFVAYSSHCGGEWREWSDAVVVNARAAPPIEWKSEGTNPVAWVAEGSHATYSRDGDPIPIWTQCPASLKRVPSPIRRFITFLLSTSEREVLSHELTGTAVAGELQPTLRNANFLAFRGAWGTSERTTLARLSVDAKNHGPLSPACQPLWIDPLWTIFCSPNWDGESDRCNGRARRSRVENPCGGTYP